MYLIRKITHNEVEEALALEVFMQSEAPDYRPEGVEVFKKDIIENKEFINNCKQGICPIYAAFDDSKIIGMRLNENPFLKEIILNSSPYGEGFYLHIGFVPLSEETEINGIRFIPMKYIVN